jgi:hypothetical protein
MRFTDANQLDRKSGVRLGRTWGTPAEGGACILDPIRAALRLVGRVSNLERTDAIAGIEEHHHDQ